MENTTILFILIIVIIFLYLNSKSNKVEQFNPLMEICNANEKNGNCRINPQQMSKLCPNNCINQINEYKDILRKLSAKEKDILSVRAHIIKEGQDPSRLNKLLQYLYNWAIYFRKQYPIDTDFSIKIEENTKEPLKPFLDGIIAQMK
jgi:hypothetical protein